MNGGIPQLKNSTQAMSILIVIIAVKSFKAKANLQCQHE